MNAKKRKMKFLATKLASLQAELKVSKEILQSASMEVEKMFKSKYFPEIPVEPKKSKEKNIEEFDEEKTQEQKQKQQQNNKQEETISTPSEPPADPEVRKMFKKIATQCHPDKLHDMEEGFEKRKKQELYNKARQALESNDPVIMSDVAGELGVEVPEITEAQLKRAEKKIISIKKELSEIESTLVWHWFFTEDKKMKTTILEKLFELMYANNPRT